MIFKDIKKLIEENVIPDDAVLMCDSGEEWFGEDAPVNYLTYSKTDNTLTFGNSEMQK